MNHLGQLYQYEPEKLAAMEVQQELQQTLQTLNILISLETHQWQVRDRTVQTAIAN